MWCPICRPICQNVEARTAPRERGAGRGFQGQGGAGLEHGHRVDMVVEAGGLGGLQIVLVARKVRARQEVPEVIVRQG